MKSKLLFPVMLMAAAIVLLPSCKKPGYPPNCSGNADSTVTTIRIIATGLNNPRGLKFGPDGNLYIAEGGRGGTNFAASCAPVPPPVGPYTGSDTGSRVSMITQQGILVTVADHLPSTKGNPLSGGAIQGMADVAFVGNNLYALIAGAGCSHGVPGIPNGIIKIKPGGEWSIIADYSSFLIAHPAANQDVADYTADGNPYSMINVDDDLYVIEPNRGVMDKITTDGNIKRIIDLSATLGHVVPTSVTQHNSNFFIGSLGLFPISPAGLCSVYKVSTGGQVSVYATGFSTITGIAFDNANRLYVLENTVGAPGPTPGHGLLVRVDPSGEKHTLVTGLNLPTAMTFGPDGNLYISNAGIGAPGAGQVVQVSFKCEVLAGDQYQ